MNTKIPFQFSILRYIHDTFTGEFLNAGLALYAPDRPYFRVRLLTKYSRVTNTFPKADGENYHRYISSLQLKFDNLSKIMNDGQINFDVPRLRKLEDILESILPSDDSSLRFGPTLGGTAQDLDITFDDLYYRLVEAHLPLEREDVHDESVVWRLFNKSLRERNVIHQLRPTTIHTPKDDIEFDHAWKNGHWNALQPISFDLMHAASIRRKSHEWFAANVLINDALDVGKIYYLLGVPQRDDAAIKKAYRRAKDLLGTGDYARKVEIVEETRAERFAESIAPQIISDAAHEDDAP